MSTITCRSNELPQHPLFDQGYSTVGDWHSSGPDVGDQKGRDTRFGGLKQECGIHVPQEVNEGLMGDHLADRVCTGLIGRALLIG